MRIRIIIADDSEVFRNGVVELLKEKDHELLVVGSAANGMEALNLVQDLKPDLVLMDVEMPVLNGIEATKTILQQFPHIKIIAWSMSSERWVVREMVEAGARGYLLKSTRVEELLLAIQRLAGGENYYCREVRRHLTVG